MYDEVSVGDRFGHYTVIAEAAPAITLSKRRRWLCKCDCGNERIVEEPNLRHGKSTNCGCVRYQNMISDRYKEGFHDGLKRTLEILGGLPDAEEGDA